MQSIGDFPLLMLSEVVNDFSFERGNTDRHRFRFLFHDDLRKRSK